MRGTLLYGEGTTKTIGIIPAYAGNTVRPHVARKRAWDHPRVCGEHYLKKFLTAPYAGSSPRMRGTPICPRDNGYIVGIIPAYAGNTGSSLSSVTVTWDHPRVCGEHLSRLPWASTLMGSSPRMRGTPVQVGRRVVAAGIIPAYAGNTLRDYSNFVVSKFMSFVFHLV